MAPATTRPYAAGPRQAAEEVAAFLPGKAGELWGGPLAEGARRDPAGPEPAELTETVKNRL
ncbi:hypothetical protein [Streptomyces sp. NPDC054786]